MKINRLKKITVAVHYSVFPPRGGGQNRIYYLYKEIAKFIEVEIISLVNENEKTSKVEVAENLWEIRVPKSKKFARKEWMVFKKTGIPVTDITSLLYFRELEEYINVFKKSASGSGCVIASHPYLYEMIRDECNKPVIYESHNVEYHLKKQMLTANKTTQKYLSAVFDIEKQATRESILTTVCTMDDAEMMEALYGLSKEKVVEVPNGFDFNSVHFHSLEERKKNKEKLGLGSALIALFVGSWHQPNIDAVYKILEIAEQKKDIIFVIIGSVGHFFGAKKYPSNVGFMGIVNDDVKEMTYKVVDMAINPIMMGSGTNLKMLDYMAAGIPVITTDIGARGLSLPENSVKISRINNFYECLDNYHKGTDVKKCFEYVRKKYTWVNIAKDYIATLMAL